MKTIAQLILLVIFVNVSLAYPQFQEETFNQQTNFQEESFGNGQFQEESFNQDTFQQGISFGRRR
jgi:hypothetical protein